MQFCYNFCLRMMSSLCSTRNFLYSLILFQVLFIRVSAQTDTTHFSSVFNSNKPYRIYLPSDYNSSTKKYPVIYLLHGNKGTHEFQIEGIQQLVDESQVLLVAWNGRSVTSDERPYNVGYHSNIKYQIQFKDYFLEFVHHIDSAYRTVPDRSQRALIGHSMGGFMSWFLAGKYPQLIGTAVNMKGSTEFFIGYPNNHTLYLEKYMFRNFNGVRLRFHNSTIDELVYLNTEVYKGALREKGLNFDYHVYPGGHSYTASEFKDVFQYTINSFHNPLPVPQRWHHADLYPNFEVWGYQVNSNLQAPGYIDMKGVTKGGMEIRTKKWEPDGREIKNVNIDVKTAPVYTPNSVYSLLDYNENTDEKKISKVTSNANGSVSFSTNQQAHQIGIYSKNGPPEIVFVQHWVNGSTIFLEHKKQCSLSIRLLNRGGSTAKKIRVTLSSTTDGIQISNPVVELNNLPGAELAWLPVQYKVTALNQPTTDGSPFEVRFNLSITDSNGTNWNDEFDVPVFYDVPAFTNIGIDDGDSEIYGSGNGDNIADPGETIMIYQGSNRTRLYYDDPYIDDEKLFDELQPDKWGDGYALSSLIHIAKDCPVGHKIKFLACYEIKEWKKIKRNVTWGTFTITVGKAEDN